LNRLVIMIPFWTVAYLIGNFLFHAVFGWQRQSWKEIIMWGLWMGFTWTFWAPDQVFKAGADNG